MAHYNYYDPSAAMRSAKGQNMEFRHQVERTPNPIWERERDFLRALILLVLGWLMWQNQYTISFTRGEYAIGQIINEGAQALKTGANNATSLLTGAPVESGQTAQPIPIQQILRGTQDQINAYIAQYSPVAQAEMRQHGIPASITLAQGLLESNAGQSGLSKKCNNHFGIKCFSKRCKRGHCHNFTDDTHKDFFIRYDNVWASYKAHSAFLKQTPRYKKCFQLAKNDYKGWARGLAKAGYATDPRYAEKLIALVEQFDLGRFDR
jgi:flagellum-specific peptidoglycan hydrolase FlgJ